MRILIFGITGMLGHVLWLKFKQSHNTFGTVRRTRKELKTYTSFFEKDNNQIIDNVDVTDEGAVERALVLSQPDIVINCIGIIKQVSAAKDPIVSIRINSLFPHILAEKCREGGFRLIHISTDCVFSGKKGLYREDDISDAEDLYGKTKYLGEVSGPNCLTIRTSIIGRELSGANGLLEWFLAQEGKEVKGYKKAIFSGLTTYALADIMLEIIEKHYCLEGIYQISSDPITKFDLLNKLTQRLSLDIEIMADESVVVDRSLDSSKFRRATKVNIPFWEAMIDDLTSRTKQYDGWKQ